jgi:hypothetical protein
MSAIESNDNDGGGVVRWTSAESLDGEYYEIPKASVVTSRWTENKRHHFALVCYSDIPLQPGNGTQHVYVDSLRNLVSGKRVGSSQVTSVVERFDCDRTGRAYPVALRIKLVAPYFVRLCGTRPVTLPTSRNGRVRFLINFAPDSAATALNPNSQEIARMRRRGGHRLMEIVAREKRTQRQGCMTNHDKRRAGNSLFRARFRRSKEREKPANKGFASILSVSQDGARCRFRTCDPYRVKVMLYR